MQGIDDTIADEIGRLSGGLTSEELNLTEVAAYFMYDHPQGEGTILATVLLQFTPSCPTFFVSSNILSVALCSLDFVLFNVPQDVALT